MAIHAGSPGALNLQEVGLSNLQTQLLQTEPTPAFSLMLAVKAGLAGTAFQAASIKGHSLQWLSCDSSKPGRYSSICGRLAGCLEACAAAGRAPLLLQSLAWHDGSSHVAMRLGLGSKQQCTCRCHVPMLQLHMIHRAGRQREDGAECWVAVASQEFSRQLLKEMPLQKDGKPSLPGKEASEKMSLRLWAEVQGLLRTLVVGNPDQEPLFMQASPSLLPSAAFCG